MIDQGRHNVLGVMVDAIDYEAAVAKVLDAAVRRRPMAVTALAVHGVMTGVQDADHAGRLNSFDLVTPDGQPVRWGLGVLHHHWLPDRVYGPTLMMRVLEECAASDLPVFVYGTTGPTLDRLVSALRGRLPDLVVAGAEPSQFAAIGHDDLGAIAARIRESGARVVLVGLGCPRQEVFVHAMRTMVDAPLLAVGAAFDYHAGQLRVPPAWMQRAGLEWLWRLRREPRRLWRRYALLNPAYAARLLAQRLGLWRPIPPPGDAEPVPVVPA